MYNIDHQKKYGSLKKKVILDIVVLLHSTTKTHGEVRNMVQRKILRSMHFSVRKVKKYQMAGAPCLEKKSPIEQSDISNWWTVCVFLRVRGKWSGWRAWNFRIRPFKSGIIQLEKNNKEKGSRPLKQYPLRLKECLLRKHYCRKWKWTVELNEPSTQQALWCNVSLHWKLSANRLYSLISSKNLHNQVCNWNVVPILDFAGYTFWKRGAAGEVGGASTMEQIEKYLREEKSTIRVNLCALTSAWNSCIQKRSRLNFLNTKFEFSILNKR